MWNENMSLFRNNSHFLITPWKSSSPFPFGKSIPAPMSTDGKNGDRSQTCDQCDFYNIEKFEFRGLVFVN